jgi:hypothetical protein
MAKNDIRNNELKAACGFYASAFARTKGHTEIDRVQFVFDSGLGDKRKN